MGRERDAQFEKVCLSIICNKNAYLYYRLHSHGIPCPEVVLLKKHVLIMSFIGKDQCPAPKLKEADLSPDQVKSAYHQCVQVMCGCMIINLCIPDIVVQGQRVGLVT